MVRHSARTTELMQTIAIIGSGAIAEAVAGYLAERENVRVGAAIVEPGGWILACANTHRLAADDFERAVFSGVKGAGRSVVSCERVPMPPEYHGDEYLKSLRVVVG